jgi:hypothetical protein
LYHQGSEEIVDRVLAKTGLTIPDVLLHSFAPQGLGSSTSIVIVNARGRGFSVYGERTFNSLQTNFAGDFRVFNNWPSKRVLIVRQIAPERQIVQN